MAESKFDMGRAADGSTLGVQIAWQKTVLQNYRKYFFLVLGAAALFTVVELWLSREGYGPANYYIGWLCLAGWAFATFHPNGIGSMFLFGAGTKAPWNDLDNLITELKKPDFKLSEMGAEGLKFIKTKYLVWSGHVALYVALQSMVLGTPGLEVENMTMAPGVLLGLLGIGFWAILLTKGAVWYKRVTIALLLGTTSVAVYGMYHGPSMTEAVATEVREMSDANLDERNAKQVEALKAFVENGGVLTPEQQATIDRATSETSKGEKLLKKAETFFHGRVIEYQVPENIAPENLNPICGIPPGEYSIHVSEGSRLLINAGGTMVSEPLTGPAHTISRPDQLHRSDYRPFGLMINGGGDGEKIVVNKKGCIVISFNTIFAQDSAFRTGEWKAEQSTVLFRLQSE